MTETDDKLLRQFFAEQKREIADDGFTKRVMHLLPHTKRTSGIWGAICGIAAIILFFAMDGVFILSNLINETFVSVFQSASTTSIDLKTVAIIAVALLIVSFNRTFSLD